MAIPQLFKVATEFKFEIGAAVLGANKLQGAVDGISKSADGALFSLKRMGISAGLSLGFGSSSLLGVASKAIFAFDKLTDQQLKFSTIMAANKDRLTGPIDTFADRMIVARQQLKLLAGDAQKFSLGESELVGTFNLLNAQLLSKGLAGKNFENARSLSRNFLKASPFLGVDPGLARGQLLRSVEGGASRGDPLFRRLTGETQSMKEFVGSAKKFNQLKPHERLNKLISALQEFTSQTEEITARTKTLNGSIRTFKNIVGGIDGILIPLGAVLQKAVVRVIQGATMVVGKEGRVIFESIASMIKPFASDLRGTVINLMQLSKLQQDLKSSSQGLAVLGISTGLGAMFKWMFKIKKIPVAAIFGGLASGVFVVGEAMRRAGVEATSLFGVLIRIGAVLAGGLILAKFGLLIPILTGIGVVASAIIPPMLAFLALFQIFSRAAAIAKVADMAEMPALLAEASVLMVRFQNIIGKLAKPINDIFNAIAESISFLFQKTILMKVGLSIFEGFIGTLEFIGFSIDLATSALSGFIEMMMKIVENLSSGNILGMLDGTQDAFSRGFDEMMAFQGRDVNGTQMGTSNNVTNIAKVEIRNDFKENMQPDRIAFSLKEQLLKTAQNPTTARGRTFTRSGYGVTGSF